VTRQAQNVKTANILIVEDNEDHAELLEFAIQSTTFSVELYIVTDGELALQFVRNEGDYADAPQPDFIFLDINLPRIDGRQVLRQIKADSSLKKIPVIVLTTSESPHDRTYCYEHHANAFLAKPLLLDEWKDMAQNSLSFWLTEVWLAE